MTCEYSLNGLKTKKTTPSDLNILTTFYFPRLYQGRARRNLLQSQQTLLFVLRSQRIYQGTLCNSSKTGGDKHSPKHVAGCKREQRPRREPIITLGWRWWDLLKTDPFWSLTEQDHHPFPLIRGDTQAQNPGEPFFYLQLSNTQLWSKGS